MISVCIATFNGEKYIVEQLNSILPQLRADDEVIISDDSSTDNTVALITAFKDKRIRLFTDQKFRNPIFNFEHCLVHAKNPIVFLSDQDDIWMPDKVQTFLKFFNEGFEVIVCDAYIVDENLSIKGGSFFENRKSGPGIIKNLMKNSYLGCCMAFKKSLLDLALPFPKDIPMHDIWLGFVAGLGFKVKFIDERLVKYRRHEENKTTASEPSSNGIWKMLLLRFNLIRYLPKLLKKRRKIGEISKR